MFPTTLTKIAKIASLAAALAVASSLTLARTKQDERIRAPKKQREPVQIVQVPSGGNHDNQFVPAQAFYGAARSLKLSPTTDDGVGAVSEGSGGGTNPGSLYWPAGLTFGGTIPETGRIEANIDPMVRAMVGTAKATQREFGPIEANVDPGIKALGGVLNGTRHDLDSLEVESFELPGPQLGHQILSGGNHENQFSVAAAARAARGTRKLSPTTDDGVGVVSEGSGGGTNPGSLYWPAGLTFGGTIPETGRIEANVDPTCRAQVSTVSGSHAEFGKVEIDAFGVRTVQHSIQKSRVVLPDAISIPALVISLPRITRTPYFSVETDGEGNVQANASWTIRLQ